MSHLDHILAELLPGQAYVCDAGCGECDPVQYDLVYRTATTPEGVEVETHAHKAWKSDCCGATMSVYTDATGDAFEVAQPLSELVKNRELRNSERN